MDEPKIYDTSSREIFAVKKKSKKQKFQDDEIFSSRCVASHNFPLETVSVRHEESVKTIEF